MLQEVLAVMPSRNDHELQGLGIDACVTIASLRVDIAVNAGRKPMGNGCCACGAGKTLSAQPGRWLYRMRRDVGLRLWVWNSRDFPT